MTDEEGKGKHPRTLSTQEASQMSGLSQGQITALLRRNKLAGQHNGKRWVVDADALEHYLTAGDATGTPIVCS